MRDGPTTISQGTFADLWEQAAPRVRAYLRVLVRASHDVDDILQETAIAVAKDFAKYDHERPFVDWAAGYARRRMLKHLSRGSRRRLAQLAPEIADQIQARLTLKDRVLEEQSEAMKQCLQELPTGARRMIDLRYQQDLDAAEIAAHQGLTVPSVYTRLSQIRAALKKCIVRRMEAQEQR